MQVKQFVYLYNEISYPVIVTHKRVKRIYYRFHDNCFYVSAPWFVLKRQIMNDLDRFAPRLISSSQVKKDNPAIGENYIYILGEKMDTSSGLLTVDGKDISFANQEELLNKLKKWFLCYLTSRTRHYESLMNLPNYRVKLKDMKTRYGSNSKHTKTISYSSILLHYSGEIIDSVIVHELAHDLVFDHSSKFYDVVYQYCPNYKIYRKKLIKGEFQ